MWRIDANGVPDTAHPLWVYDDNADLDGPGGGDVAVDFWHSATFSWEPQDRELQRRVLRVTAVRR